MSILVTFTDTSSPGPSGPITAWAWDFGDGGTSTSQNPTHTYAAYGTYTVSLTITGTSPDGTATGTGTVTLVAPGSLTAAFVDSTSGLTATFTDESTPGPSGPITGWAWTFGDSNTSASQNPTHTYASASTYTAGLTVTGTSPDGTSSVSHSVTVSSTPGPSGFPSALSTSGRSIVDPNGHALPRLKGFNIQAAGWPQSAYNDIYAKGGRILRLMVFWDELEPTAGNINTTFVSALDTSISRAQTAGLYVVLCFYYGPNGVHKPSWVPDSTLGSYTGSSRGQHATEYLAKRYGDVSDPLGAGKYTKAVIGMGINEPTPDSSSNGYLATHLSEQHTMMSWFRAYAPAWIGFISCGYGGGAPVPNAPGSGQTSQTFTAAANDPFSGIGNWLMEVHCYFETTPDGESRTWDGRNAYGMPNGSTQIKADTSSYPPSGHTRAKCQASLAAWMAPYIQYCGSGRANVPLVLGEWGWKSMFSGGDLYAADFAAAAASAGAAVEMEWDYNTSTSSDPWAARPGGSWQTATTAWMSAA